MTPPIDAVLFDIDDTLCAYRRPGEELLDEAFASEEIDPFFEIGEYYDRFEEFATGQDATREVRAACFAAIAAERGYDPTVGRALAERYETTRDHRDVTFLPGAREAIDALADDHRLGVVTNGGPDTQTPKLGALGLTEAFETVVYAGHDAAPKPDRAPFDRALGDLGIPAERAVHIGNSFEADVAGAHAAGLRSVWVPEEGSYDERGEPDDPDGEDASYELRSLHELTPVPWQ
ncbi:haloacid dehalogenase [Halobacteriales archaeon QS_3_64_16]|nr:MAG: haloacid dehalogenase [Halobacteriales archaeon QS_3_64_16]